MPVASSVMTEKGVTSEPVPEVVGTAIMSALVPSVGRSYTRLRMSRKRWLRPSNCVPGCSYMSHITLAASMGLPPPTAMMTSGWNSSICARPLRTVASVGSGSTS